MTSQIDLGDITIDVVLKDIKNVHLSVYPPNGRVRISAPERMDLDTIRIFAISKLGWIRKQQRKLQEQERETPREYLDRESHFLWGKRYLLTVIERDQSPTVTLGHNRLTLVIRPDTEEAKKEAVVDAWYREQLKREASRLIGKWEEALSVSVDRFFVQRMKTRWGSCNPVKRHIRLNTELAKKPRECLEYIVVHEMVHLIEPTHNAHFVALMDKFIPRWQFYRERLNRLPVRHEDWMY